MKDKAKENGDNKGDDARPRRLFAYAFTIMDLNTRLYLACGHSLRSEKEAFEGAMAMLSHTDVELSSMRLDRYYSYPTYVNAFGGETRVYVMPKRNSTLKGSQKWKDTMKEFIKDTMGYLEEYHRRSNSESGLLCTG